MPTGPANKPIAPKSPIRRLPESIEVPQDATVDGVKVAVARQCGFSDHNRIGLFNPVTRKTLKDRNAVVLEDADVATAKELLVKDLGTHQPLLLHHKHMMY